MQVIYNCNSDKHNTYALVVQCTKLTLHLPFSRKVIQKSVLDPTWIKTVRCSSSTTRSTYRLFWSSVQISCIRIFIAGSDCIGIWKNNQVFTTSLKGTVFWSNLIASLVYLITDLSLTAPVSDNSLMPWWLSKFFLCLDLSCWSFLAQKSYQVLLAPSAFEYWAM